MTPILLRRAASRVALLVLALVHLAPSARAQDAGVDAGITDAGGAALEADPRPVEIRALIDGTLDVHIEAQSLFEIPLADEQSVQVELVRLRALLGLLASQADAGVARGAGKVAAATAAAAASAKSAVAALDPAHWRARDELDRARLEFYALPRTQRDALLATHAAQVEAAKPKETDEQRHAREAKLERERALEDARTARSEAERLVGNELARLISVEAKVAKLDGSFEDVRVDLAARKDSLLGWQRRVSEAKSGPAQNADDTYDALRKTLRSSRDDLDRALDALASPSSSVPDLGPDRLSEVPAEVSTAAARKRRASVQKAIERAKGEEQALRDDRASTLLLEIDTLNRARLDLLRHLSDDKQSDITGFASAGLDQARSEGRQLLLILRYHRHVAGSWLGDLRDRQTIAGASGWRIGARVLPFLFALIGFIWLRRRSVVWLALAERRASEADRREQRAAPSLLRRSLRFVAGFQRTLEWLLLYWLVLWLLPDGMRGLLEIQLLEVVVGWTLGGALIVNVINAIATAAESGRVRAGDSVAQLRLRSLRLVGRVIVAFVVLLLVSARLVGEGTIFHWVTSTCWIAAIPVFLILVRWWRSVVFERVERVRRKSEMRTWVLANRDGWKSFFAAMIATVHLFAVGFYKVLRNWITGFNLARRAHAYLFKRELDRLAGEKPVIEAATIRPDTLASLAPDRPSDIWVEPPAAQQIEALRQTAHGIVALVGARGAGKTSLLRHLENGVKDATIADCRDEAWWKAVESRLDVSTEAEGPPPVVLLDNAQALSRPIRGGLVAFDKALELARSHCDSTLWVFAIDAAVWPFLSRSRDARPLFDQVITLRAWNDEQIGELLSQRSAEAGISPSFEDLLEKLPSAADEIDKQEALTARRAGYFRMVWDYARGNPSMALEVWRASLREDAAGSVRVRSLVAPDTAALESLPDSSLFILRAILQMDPATVEEISQATRLGPSHVRNAIRFGASHGYLIEEGGGVRVTWSWLRSIVVLLERRHLLVNA